MSAGGAFGFLAEVEEEIAVQFEATLLGVGVELQHQRTLPSNVRVELIIPTADERVGHVEPLAIQTELQHLRSTGGLFAANLGSVPDQPADPDLTRQFGFRRIPKQKREAEKVSGVGRAAGIVGWRRIIETHRNVARVVGLDDSTAPYV